MNFQKVNRKHGAAIGMVNVDERYYNVVEKYETLGTVFKANGEWYGVAAGNMSEDYFATRKEAGEWVLATVALEEEGDFDEDHPEKKTVIVKEDVPGFYKGQVIEVYPSPSWCWSHEKGWLHGKETIGDTGYARVVDPSKVEDMETAEADPIEYGEEYLAPSGLIVTPKPAGPKDDKDQIRIEYTEDHVFTSRTYRKDLFVHLIQAGRMGIVQEYVIDEKSGDVGRYIGQPTLTKNKIEWLGGGFTETINFWRGAGGIRRVNGIVGKLPQPITGKRKEKSLADKLRFGHEKGCTYNAGHTRSLRRMIVLSPDHMERENWGEYFDRDEIEKLYQLVERYQRFCHYCEEVKPVWKEVDRTYWADNSVDVIEEDQNGNRRSRMVSAPSGDLCF